MTEKLREYLDGLFAAVPDTKEVREAKDELYDGMVERYEDCLREGMDEQAAYDCVVDSIGDIRELIDELDTGSTQDKRTAGSQAGVDVADFVRGITDFAGGFISGLFGSEGNTEATPTELTLYNNVVLSLDDVSSINISYLTEKLEVQYTTDNQLIIHEYFNREDETLFAETTYENGSINVRNGRRSGFFGLRSKVELFLPASWEGSLSIITVSGSIKLPNQWKLSSLNLKTISGSIEVGSVAAGMIQLGSTSGSIKADMLNGALDLHSISGSIKVENAAGGGSFNTTSGGIRVNFTGLSSHVKASSISGGVRLGLPADASVELEAASGTGSIHTGFDDKLNFVRRNKAHGFVGTAPYQYVRISTTTGGIHVND